MCVLQKAHSPVGWMVNRCGLRSECVYVEMMQFSVRSSLVVILRCSPRFAEQIDSLLPYMVTFVKENGDSCMHGGEYSE